MKKWIGLLFTGIMVLLAEKQVHAQQRLSDNALLDKVQEQTFQYFWDAAEPVSGMARERYHVDGVYPSNDKNIVTTGGSGFGIMALIVGIDRKWITRKQGVERFEKILHFLETADRFHGAWSHWINGETGKVKPFGRKDNGADLVETSYLLQGLLCARQYFVYGNKAEKAIADRIDHLWQTVEFNWFQHGQEVLYWHWSPEYQWQMNFPVKGVNECLIMYILAASSPQYGITAAVYEKGWSGNGNIHYEHEVMGYPLQLRYQGDYTNGVPLFWTQYSFLGLDPMGLTDKYADYGTENKHQSLINYTWCVQNPLHYKGYGSDSWGLTASYSTRGYAAHGPDAKNDLGVISPTAAISAIPYTPEESMKAIRHWYEDLSSKVWGPYGFYDAFSETAEWYPQQYLAIDQGPEIVMIENYRTGLLWKLFMSCPEVQSGLHKLGFQSPLLKK